MRTFIKYNGSGEILSVCRTEFVPPQFPTAFGELDASEKVLELSERDAVGQLASEIIHDNYQVAVDQGKLVRKS